MRVAALSDVHGNLPALEAVLAEVEAEAPELIVSCGDVAAGPLPAETIDLLMGLANARFVRGNADREMVDELDGRRRDFLASFDDTVSVEVDGLGRVLFCHGTPHSDVEMMTSRTPDDVLRERLGRIDADVVVCGHTHMQFDRTVEGVRVVNCGSVGMPYGEPGAFWALLGPELDFRRTDYDREGAAELIRRRSEWEHADEFVEENLLRVPSADEAFAFFETVGGP